nr:MAG TPA: hypothetical protein [Caudoviricetes sp.]
MYHFSRLRATFCVPPNDYSNGAICRLLHFVQSKI